MATLLLGQNVEHPHALNGEILQDHQALYDGLCFPIEKIPERYVRQQLCVALKLRFQCGGVDRRITARMRHVSLDDFHGHLKTGYVSHNDQFFVFIHHVELMDDVEKRIERVGSVVGLEFFDQSPDANVGDSLYLSFVTRKQVVLRRSVFENRELDIARLFAGAMTGTGKEPSNVVEARPLMMNGLSRQNSETQWDGKILVVLNLLQEKLVVILAENWVFAVLKEPLDFGLQIEDVLLGPL